MKKFAISLCLLATPVLALDCKKPVTDQNGVIVHEGVKDGKYDPSSPVLTLGTVVGSALFAPKQAAQGPRGASDSDPVASAKRAALGLRLIACDKIDLTSEQVVEIKSALGAFPPLTVLRVLEEIDPALLKP